MDLVGPGNVRYECSATDSVVARKAMGNVVMSPETFTRSGVLPPATPPTAGRSDAGISPRHELRGEYDAPGCGGSGTAPRRAVQRLRADPHPRGVLLKETGEPPGYDAKS
jgi:hypothetical protein